jgi:D-alanyl-D-alanine carboxypeptidase
LNGRRQPSKSTTTPLRIQQATRRRVSVFGLGLTAIFLISAVGALTGIEERPKSQSDALTCVDMACQPDAPVLGVTVAREMMPSPYLGQDANRWRSMTQVAPPEIGGQAAAVIEGSCGKLIYGKDENLRLEPASLTKMVSAMVTVESTALTERVPVSINGWDLASEDESTIMGLEAGMNLSVRDLLYGMMLPSGNDAALTLADHIGGPTQFVQKMNRRVQAMGLRNTQFVNPDGRHADGQYSTALDMALIGREMMSNPLLREVARTETYLPEWSQPMLWNGNYLLYNGFEGVTGVKTGWTEEAEYTIVASARRDGRELFAGVMKSWNLYLDAMRLLDWAFKNTQPACG